MRNVPMVLIVLAGGSLAGCAGLETASTGSGGGVAPTPDLVRGTPAVSHAGPPGLGAADIYGRMVHDHSLAMGRDRQGGTVAAAGETEESE